MCILYCKYITAKAIGGHSMLWFQSYWPYVQWINWGRSHGVLDPLPPLIVGQVASFPFILVKKQPSCRGWVRENVTYCLASCSGCGSGERCSSAIAGRSVLLISEQLADISSLLSRLCSNISGSRTLTTSSNNWHTTSHSSHNVHSI